MPASGPQYERIIDQLFNVIDQLGYLDETEENIKNTGICPYCYYHLNFCVCEQETESE